MRQEKLLGYPLTEAVRRLAAEGITPAVSISRAPRRQDDPGVLRVVRVEDGGKRLTACAFVDGLKENG